MTIPHFILTTCVIVEVGPVSGIDINPRRPVTLPVITGKDGSTSELLVTMQQIHGDTLDEIIEDLTAQVRQALESFKTETPTS